MFCRSDLVAAFISAALLRDGPSLVAPSVGRSAISLASILPIGVRNIALHCPYGDEEECERERESLAARRKENAVLVRGLQLEHKREMRFGFGW